MENRGFWLRIQVMVLVLGMTVTGCVKAQTDTRLIGTWINPEAGEWKFQSKNFEILTEDISFRGTYTTDNGIINFKVNQVFFKNPDKLEFSEWGVGKKWYTRNELFDAMKPTAVKNGLYDENSMNAMIDLFFILFDHAYSIDKNTLILTNKFLGNETIYTKK